MWQKKFLDALLNDFKVNQQKDPTYSVRAFSRKVGLSPGSTSEILRGQGHRGWKISASRAMQILERLDISALEKRRILALLDDAPVNKETEWAESNYDLLTDWIYLAVLSAFDLRQPSACTPSALSERFGLSVEKIDSVLNVLIDRQLLEQTESGELVKRPENWATTDGIPNKVLVDHHHSNLKLAGVALDQLPTEERDFNSLTFAGSKKQISLLREEIRKFINRSEALMETVDANDEVFRLSICLFPINFKEGSV